VDVAVDAVGSRASVETVLHATRAGGRVVLAGMPATADFSAAWFRELEVTGSYASAQRESTGEPAFEIAGRLVRGDAVRALAESIVRYPLYRWREALDHASGAGGLGTVKVAFDPRSRG
jgi:threonine dehydrogenase-like Zn-dependent dehydrogenase